MSGFSPGSPRWTRARDRLAYALTQEVAMPYRPVQAGTPAAVLVLAALSEANDDVEILLTRRTETVETHKGQYALPGGMTDPEDRTEGASDEATSIVTALRECEEETGIYRSRVDAIGTLPKIWTPSGFLITPVVGIARAAREELPLTPSPAEIAEIFWVSLGELTREGVHSTERRRVGEVDVPIDVFQIGPHRVWGATGAILRNFLLRMGYT